MIAILNTSMNCAWADVIGTSHWSLLPIANRPLLDYWLELCSELSIPSVQIVLGEHSRSIERYCGDGKRWNVRIEYTHARKDETPTAYLRSVFMSWQDGLIYMGGPLFFRRRQAFRADALRDLATCRHNMPDGGEPLFLFGRSSSDIAGLIEKSEAGSERGLEQVHVNPWFIDSVGSYFELNMKMVAGEFARYTTAGFSEGDQSSIGFNVRTPPSSHLLAPILVADDCRFGPMTTIGPNAVVANHVIVDSSSELIDCLVLPDTYIGRNLDIHGKIVAGNRVISPDDGTVVEIDDSWVVARNRPSLRSADIVRSTFLWFIALGLVLVQLVPFILLYAFVRMRRVARLERRQYHDPRTGYISLPMIVKSRPLRSPFFSLFKALSLDRFPLLVLVVRGRLFLCGQPPMRHPEDDGLIKQLPEYYPGVFCYQDYNKESDRLTDALWYAHIRSIYEDLKILSKALLYRFFRAGR